MEQENIERLIARARVALGFVVPHDVVTTIVETEEIDPIITRNIVSAASSRHRPRVSPLSIVGRSLVSEYDVRRRQHDKSITF